MAIVATARAATANNRNFKVWDCATAAADTGPINIAHGFGVVPFVWYAKHVSAAAPPEWSVNADITNIIVAKLNAAGSGGGNPTVDLVLTIFAARPNSLMK